MVAIQSGMGIGMGKTMTGALGTITARAPARAKIPPEAPYPCREEPVKWAYRVKREFPARPPRKNTARKLLSPAARMRKPPRK